MQTTGKHAIHQKISLTEKLLEFQAAFARKMRKKRIALFKSLISSLPRPLHIFDVGGLRRQR